VFLQNRKYSELLGKRLEAGLGSAIKVYSTETRRLGVTVGLDGGYI
jgi:hypothetical protein